ncbi:multicopper oxidase [Calocera viscosa TUFC12733]|uniref:Multicopper oxidase n=1 Tax=Calocera viscosa (strain TUFC12733) TaxID=1330018 RepID=A0A167K781_CALVF|nr:multicopper oxidase [Calocera viscosa TUFC12733]
MADPQVEKTSVSSVEAAKATSTSRRLVYIVGGAVVAVVVLALGLGLGLGLGLKNRNNGTSAGSSGNSTAPSNTTSLPNVTLPAIDSFILPDIRNDPPQVRYYSLVVSEGYGNPDGFARQMLVVNGTYPGPTIVANENDRMIITVHNAMLNNATAIHWHGLYQNTTPFYDGAHGISQCGIPPGQSFTYNFTLDGWTGTTWYHSHYQTQYTDGAVGALVINPSNATTNADGQQVTPAPTAPNLPEWDADFVVILQDWYHGQSQDVLEQYMSPNGPDGTQGDEPTPESGTINGQGQWLGGGTYQTFALQAGKTYRFRLINSGSLGNVRFSIDDHPLTIVSADGVDVQPVEVAGVEIAVAQRYDVLVRTNQTTGGQWWMRGTVLTDMFTYSLPDAWYDHRAVLSYPVASPSSTPLNSSSPDPGPGFPGLGDLGTKDYTALTPALAGVVPGPDVTYVVQDTFERAQNSLYYGYMNGTSWAPLEGETTMTLLSTPSFLSALVPGPSFPEGQYLLTSLNISVVDLILYNIDDGDHPFHLHGHRPWFVGTGSGAYDGQALNATGAMLRDTHVVPNYSWIALRFVTDNPGIWAFHCHIAWHMGAGLLMQIASQPQVALSYGMPQEVVEQCAAGQGGQGVNGNA